MSERPIKCARNFDEWGRIILQKGDIVGLVGKGLTGWANRNFVRPRTELFHWLLIGDYLPTEDDYTTLESVNKGVTVGRLSWYMGRAYTVFRWNHADAANKGRQAYDRASKFGRHRYDWFMAAGLFFTWVRHGFRPLHVRHIPYERDDRFLCTELVFEAYRLAGIRLRTPGHAPLPAEIKIASQTGVLVQIDQHDGREYNWRKKVPPKPDPMEGVVMAMDDASPDALVFKRALDSRGLQVAFGVAGERIKRGDFVHIDPADGKVYRINRPPEVITVKPSDMAWPIIESSSHLVGAQNADEAMASAARADNAAKIDRGIEQTMGPPSGSPTYVAKAKKSTHPSRDKTHLWTPDPIRSGQLTMARRACDGHESHSVALKIVHVVTNRRVVVDDVHDYGLWPILTCERCMSLLLQKDIDRIFPATYYARPEGGD